MLGNSSLPSGDASEKRNDKYHAKAEAYIRHMRNLADCNRHQESVLEDERFPNRKKVAFTNQLRNRVGTRLGNLLPAQPLPPGCNAKT